MASVPANSSDRGHEHAVDREHRLNQIIADYLEANETGQPTDRDAFLKQNPRLAAELTVFFANQDHVAELPAPLRDSERSALSLGSCPELVPFPGALRVESQRLDRHTSSESHVRYFGDYELI